MDFTIFHTFPLGWAGEGFRTPEFPYGIGGLGASGGAGTTAGDTDEAAEADEAGTLE